MGFKVWYFADTDSNEVIGPLSDSEVRSLVGTGTITPDTKVWRAGWPEEQWTTAQAAKGFPADHAQLAMAARAAKGELSVNDLALRLSLLEARLDEVSSGLPQSSILSPDFWTRAWAIFGHQLAAGAVIYAGLILLVFLLGSFAGL